MRICLRRRFIAGLGGTAALPLAVRAQQGAMPVIGFLFANPANDTIRNFTVGILQSLKETGYVEGQNVAIEYRYVENQYDRLPALAADLVRRRVAVIVAGSPPPQLWRRRQRLRPYPSSFSPPLTRSSLVLSPASTGPARTLPAAPVLVESCRQNDCNCSASWCPMPPGPVFSRTPPFRLTNMYSQTYRRRHAR